MSTLYNRRRGAKSYQPRKPRQCCALPCPTNGPGAVRGIHRLRTRDSIFIGCSEHNPLVDPVLCPRLADTASRFCSDHR